MNYYRDILLTRDLLPDIKQYSDYFTFSASELVLKFIELRIMLVETTHPTQVE